MIDIVDWLRKEAELIALPRLKEAADEIERLRAALELIGKRSAPGNRTMDAFIRDMTWINDETRRMGSHER